MHLTSGTTGDGVLGMVITSSPFSALALMPAQVAQCHSASTHQRAQLVSTHPEYPANKLHIQWVMLDLELQVIQGASAPVRSTLGGSLKRSLKAMISSPRLRFPAMSSQSSLVTVTCRPCTEALHMNKVVQAELDNIYPRVLYPTSAAISFTDARKSAVHASAKQFFLAQFKQGRTANHT